MVWCACNVVSVLIVYHSSQLESALYLLYFIIAVTTIIIVIIIIIIIIVFVVAIFNKKTRACLSCTFSGHSDWSNGKYDVFIKCLNKRFWRCAERYKYRDVSYRVNRQYLGRGCRHIRWTVLQSNYWSTHGITKWHKRQHKRGKQVKRNSSFHMVAH